MASGSSALVKRSTDTELMPPPTKRIKRPRKVLDEESYTDAISQIIARDFFPGLLESETQQEYLDALESKDGAWISSAGRRLTQIMTPGRKRGRRGTSIQTPLGGRAGSKTPVGFGGETPMTVMSEVSAASTAVPKIEVDTNMSLDAFQAKYTSEDNESFNKLLDAQNQKRAEKYAWMWRGNKLPSKMMIAQAATEQKLIASGQSIVDDGGVKDRLAIRDPSDKPAQTETWKSKPDNTLMFRPSSIEDSLPTIAQVAQANSRAAPRGVAYANTRLPDPTSIGLSSAAAPPSPSLSAIRDAIAGRPRATDSESGFDGAETPRVNGYAFVDDEEPEPEPVPVALTEIILGKGDATPNPFTIRAQSAREDLHHRMVDRVARNKRAGAAGNGKGAATPVSVPRFPSSPRVGRENMTPAAQRLWSRVGKTGGIATPVGKGSRLRE